MKLTIEVEHFSGPELSPDEMAEAFTRTFNTVPGNTFAILPEQRALAAIQRADKSKEKFAAAEKAMAETEASTYQIASVS